MLTCAVGCLLAGVSKGSRDEEGDHPGADASDSASRVKDTSGAMEVDAARLGASEPRYAMYLDHAAAARALASSTSTAYGRPSAQQSHRCPSAGARHWTAA